MSWPTPNPGKLRKEFDYLWTRGFGGHSRAGWYVVREGDIGDETWTTFVRDIYE